MWVHILLVLLPIATSCLAAAEDIKPLDVKLGLWEVTSTLQTTGMPPVPPDAMAKMTPEQRARIEQMMKPGTSGTPKTVTQKSCLTREKMNKLQMFGEERGSCKRTVVNSSSSKLELELQCTTERMKTNETLRMEAVNSQAVKGSAQIVSTSADRTMNMNSNFTAKWVGPNCGDVK